jgi:pimeloyl-ACP methyl ester carboxylesterase
LTLVVLASALAVVVATAVPRATSASSGEPGARCRHVEFSVQVLGGPHKLAGTQCQPATGRPPRAAVVLVHGTTYNHRYWDFSIDPQRYSAARILASAGYVTLSVDLLGVGGSDRPPATEVTADVSASALHQAIEHVRSDPAARTSSGKLFLVGHSSGSTLAVREAATFGDVDGVVSTGFLHSTGSAATLFPAMIHPAAGDPKFENDPSIPAGYITTRPGVRGIFYYPFNAEERVVSEDEATKDAPPGGDPSGLAEERATGTYARRLTAPVLVLIGQRDLSFCSPPACPQAAKEAGFYPASPDLEVVTRPRAAHDLNLQRSAPETTDIIRRWIRDRSG